MPTDNYYVGTLQILFLIGIHAPGTRLYPNPPLAAADGRAGVETADYLTLAGIQITP